MTRPAAADGQLDALLQPLHFDFEAVKSLSA